MRCAAERGEYGLVIACASVEVFGAAVGALGTVGGMLTAAIVLGLSCVTEVGTGAAGSGEEETIKDRMTMELILLDLKDFTTLAS